jgi:hypothetical protein
MDGELQTMPERGGLTLLRSGVHVSGALAYAVGEHTSQASYPFLNPVWFHTGEVETHHVLSSAVGKERRARSKRHVSGQSFL